MDNETCEPPPTENMGSHVVSGVVVLAEQTPSFEQAQLHMRLEDVSYADAPSRTVTTTVENVAHRQGEASRWLFALPTNEASSRANYSVQAHLCLSPTHEGYTEDNPPAVLVGDFVSTAAHPVLTRGNPSAGVEVYLHRVGGDDFGVETLRRQLRLEVRKRNHA